MDSIPEPPPRTQTAAPAKAAGLRILVLGLNASPEPIGIGKYSGEMMAWLAARGHRVTGVAAPPYYPAWRVWDGWSAGRYATERRDGVDLVRCPLYVPHRPGGARRLVHLMSFAASSLPAACAVARRLRPQVVVAVAPTLSRRQAPSWRRAWLVRLHGCTSRTSKWKPRSNSVC